MTGEPAAPTAAPTGVRTRHGSPLDSPRLRAAASTLAPALILVILQLLLFPMPMGVWVQGFTVGLLGALVALGMALVYRANRILNFAQGDLGVAPVTLSVLLIQSFAWSYFMGLAVGLVAAVAVGALVELAIIRRFFRAPRLILTVATIGISQLLAVISLLLPQWLADLTGRERIEVTATAERIAFPVDIRIDLEPLIFTADYVVAWIVAPAVMVALAVWLRYSNVGMAIRASAERSDRAALLGVPVKRLNTYVWALAAVLSFVGLYLRAGITGLPFGSGIELSFTVLLMALAALMLGKLTNLPTIATSAVALGLLEQGVSWNDEVNLGLFTLNSEEAVLITPILGLIIVVALFLQRRGSSRVENEQGSSWQSAEDVRPVPPELRREREVVLVRAALIVAAGAFLLALPHLLQLGAAGARNTLLAGAVVVYAIITLSIVMLTGWAGQLSLGQMGFVGVGGAVSAYVTNEWGLDLTLSLLVAGVAGAVVALIVGLPALRLRGLYLGVITLAFALSMSSYFLNRQFFPWVPTDYERGELFGRFDVSSPTRIYYVCLAGLGLMVFLVSGIRHSRTGRVMIALRENERATQAYGISATRAKLTAFASSGFVAAFAGALLVFHQGTFSLNLIAPDQNLVVFTAAVVGGLGTMLGAVLGAVYLQGGKWFVTGDFQIFQLLTTSLGVLLVLLILPGGLGGLVYRARDLWLRSVARRRGILVPSLVADTAALEQEVEAAFEERAATAAVEDAAGATGASEDGAFEDSPSEEVPVEDASPARATTGSAES